MADDTYELALEVDTQPVERAEEKVQEAEQEIYKFATVVHNAMAETKKGFEGAELAAYELADEVHRVELTMEQFLSTQIQVDQGATRLSGSLGGATGSARQLGRAVLEGSRGLEDLQYGFYGVVNNIPSFVMAMGGSMGVAGVISLVAIGVNQVVNHWDDLTRMFNDTTALPEAADKTRVLHTELHQAEKRMKELEEAGYGTAEQIAEYNKLTERTVELEKQVTAEKEKQKRLKKVDAAKTDEEEQLQKRRKEIAEEHVATHKEGMIETMTEVARQAAEQEFERSMEDVHKYRGKDAKKFNEALGRARFYDKTRKTTGEGAKINRDHAKDLIGRFMEGDLDAWRLIYSAEQKNPRLFPGMTGRRLEEMGPDYMRRKDSEAAQKKIAAKRKKELEKEAQADHTKHEREAAKRAREAAAEERKRAAEAKTQAAEAKKKKTTDLAAKKKGVAAAHKEATDLVREMSAGGLGKQAALAATQMRAQGGMVDQFGRFHKLSAEEQTSALGRQLGAMIAAQRPELGKFTAGNVGMQMAFNAQNDVDKRLMGVGVQGLNAQGRLITVAQQLNAEIAQMGAHQNAMMRQIAELERRVGQRSRTNLARGAVR